jgi:hypothetical protein
MKKRKDEYSWQFVTGYYGIGDGRLHGDVPECCPTCGQPNFKENYYRKYLQDERRRIEGLLVLSPKELDPE